MRVRSGGRAVVAAVLVMAALSVVGGSPSSGAPASPISVSSSSGSFAQVAVGDVGTKVFTVKNTSASAVGFTLTVGVPPFGIYPGGTTCTGGTLAAGASCKVTVWFSPTVTGSYSGSLRVLADGSGADPVGTELASGALSGQGIAPYVVTPSSSAWSFGNWAIGSTSPSKTFTVTNRHAPGGLLRTVSNVVWTNPDFIRTGGTCDVGLWVPSGGSCTVTMAFAPRSAGLATVSDQVRVEFGPELPATVNVSGQKVAAIGLAPTPVAFGTVKVGIPSTKTLTATNQASFDVGLGAISVSSAGPFSVTATTCAATLAAQATCTIDVTLAPTVIGAQYAKLKIPVADPVKAVARTLGVARSSLEPKPAPASVS